MDSKVSFKPLLAAGFDLKGFKSWNSRDGGGYQFSLTHLGVKVAEVTNEGRGGPVDIDWVNLTKGTHVKVAFDTLAAVVAAIPPQENEFRPDHPLKVDAGWLMEEMANLAGYRKLCKGKTVFSKAGEPDTFFSIKVPYDAKTKAYILNKYPGATILNDEIGA